nr:glycerol-3-phosphate acyltransferase [Chloroflexota bacterium]
MQSVLLIIVGYLLGSIPTAYLAGRWLKGIDLREYGSGTVSGTGVIYHVGLGAGVVAGLLDVAKGALATWLVLRLGSSLTVGLLAGLAAVIGHNWPLYLKFKGGRGISPFMGVMLVVFPLGVLWLLLFLAAGRLLKLTALVAFCGILTLPLLTYITRQPTVVILTSIGMLLITVIKRLEANRLPLPSGPERRQVLIRRLLFDRDVDVNEEWVSRRPAG